MTYKKGSRFYWDTWDITGPNGLRRLVDLVDQFAVVLTVMPFVSVETKAKAIASLKGFNADDVKKAGHV